jgi:hypothetical protein
MSDDWQVGDLAVCVDDSPCHCGCGLPVSAGSVYRVTRVWPPQHGKIGLSLSGVTIEWPHRALAGQRFRKIHPDKHEDCEPEFIELLKRIRTPAHA